MSTAHQPYLSPEEYLRLERASDVRHEYFDGAMFAMAGASRMHNHITVNLTRLVSTALLPTECETFAGDMKVKISRTGLYAYPDLIVTCEKPRFEDDVFDTLLNPQVILEVLSPSTEAYDRGKKFSHYRQIASLKEYVLVAQDDALIHHYARTDDGRWLLSEANGLESTLALPALDLSLPLTEIYRRVSFPPATDGTSAPAAS